MAYLQFQNCSFLELSQTCLSKNFLPFICDGADSSSCVMKWRLLLCVRFVGRRFLISKRLLRRANLLTARSCLQQVLKVLQSLSRRVSCLCVNEFDLCWSSRQLRSAIYCDILHVKHFSFTCRVFLDSPCICAHALALWRRIVDTLDWCPTASILLPHNIVSASCSKRVEFRLQEEKPSIVVKTDDVHSIELKPLAHPLHMALGSTEAIRDNVPTCTR